MPDRAGDCGYLSFRPCALFKASGLVLRIFVFRLFFWRRGSLGLGFKYEIPLRVIINYEEQHVAGSLEMVEGIT